MNSNHSKDANRFFNFKWDAFDAPAGIKYVLGVIAVYVLGGWLNFPWFTAGVCALLVWLTDVPGSRKDRVLGMLAFGLIGILLTLFYHLFNGSLVIHLIVIFTVTFAGTMVMISGSRSFMVGWCAIYWFLLVPLFSDLEAGPSATVISLVAGTVVVISLTLLGGLFGRQATEPSAISAADKENPDTGFVIGYSLTLAITMVIGLWIGSLWLETDPTLVANAAFMVIGMSSRQTWTAGIERATGAILGIIFGFYLFQLVTDDLIVFALGVGLSFLCMALMNVNPAAFIFFFLTYMSHSWVSQGLEQANLIANERILAEVVGVVLAGFAVNTLIWWAKRRRVITYVTGQQSGI